MQVQNQPFSTDEQRLLMALDAHEGLLGHPEYQRLRRTGWVLSEFTVRSSSGSQVIMEVAFVRDRLDASQGA